jgi:hypothetical protein
MFTSSGEDVGVPTQLGSLERANLNHWKKSRNSVALNVMYHLQSRLECTHSC